MTSKLTKLYFQSATCAKLAFKLPRAPRSSCLFSSRNVLLLRPVSKIPGTYRLKTTITGSAAKRSAKYNGKKVPQRLLVYHAGTPRTTFLACLKVTTLFGLAFFTFLVAPAYIASNKPWWQTAGVATCGIVPFVVVSYTTAPFVVFVHLSLPPFARHPSRELLRRFVHNIPASTRLDFTTMNLVGRPRVTSVPVGSLTPAAERLRIVNLLDTTTVTRASARSGLFSVSSHFPWIKLPPVTRFGAPRLSNSKGTREGWAWPDILDCIEQRARGTDSKLYAEANSNGPIK